MAGEVGLWGLESWVVRGECEPQRRPQAGSLLAAALDITKFVPKVDLQADYNTAKVRGGPRGRGAGFTQGYRVRSLTLPTCVFRVCWVLATRPCGWHGRCGPGRS